MTVAVSLVTIGLSAIATYVWVTNTYAWKRVADIEKEVADIEKEVADIEKEVADIAAKRAAINAESQRWPAYSPDHHHTTQDPNRHLQEVTVSPAFLSYHRGGWAPQPSTLSLSRDITPSQDGDQ